MNNNKIIGIGLFTIGAGVIAYMLLNKPVDINFSSKVSRYLSFSPSYCFAGLGLAIDLPMVDEKYYADHEVKLNRSRLAWIHESFGLYIDNISRLVNLPSSLIKSFIFIESGGLSNSINGRAVGLMQVSDTSATDIIWMENNTNRLTAAEKSILSNYLGGRLSQILSMPSPGVSQIITQSDLLNPELNILVGSIYLGQLVDEHTMDNTVRLDKVVIRYNMGYYAYSRGRKLIGDAISILKNLNPETRNYVVKLLGQNGILETAEAEHCGG